ncbi:uncharacterized protein Tco025E_00292 [Trypanosoma conorhini]|uniref:Uncharacterized protein n=1 Tax=Trypanosoma conorhini TaxID=83891 RepID=A0A422QBY3_9TRYP|nr:uncharacterized protein Tco025E_00292 [Trypanosoma conorhini]RNF27490.1 hypothetical protein Tco025E_00292 [Trypanosoma conorhini]
MFSRGGATKQTSSVQEQLLQLLQQQVAIEERLNGQRALMQRITEGFAVLREWATRHAHNDLSLHDLLVLEAYGGNRSCRSAASPSRKKEEAEEEEEVDGDKSNRGEPQSRGSGNPAWQQQQLLLLRGANRAYRSFIRARVLDEGCATPDSPVQFHTLTADSFYLLLPHLTEMLQEIAGPTPGAARMEPTGASVSRMCSLQPPSSPLLSPSGSHFYTSATEWCASLARVLRFLELGLKHFSEVLENSRLRPLLAQSLAQLQARGRDCGHTREEAVLQLCQRAGALREQLHRLAVEDSHKDDYENTAAHYSGLHLANLR